jgi:hypothetical protein
MDNAIMNAIDLAADMAKTGEIGRIEVPVRRPISDDERANLGEYAQLAGVELAVFRDYITIQATRR